ncbi:hypothetical protein, partial [Mycolicibacterium celeriflavum]|uniref:hypothetical protein n=1 Tax=Mycolicibacterium celeriflavum TaxID=1249101 RepID=UPI0021F2DC2C
AKLHNGLQAQSLVGVDEATRPHFHAYEASHNEKGSCTQIAIHPQIAIWLQFRRMISARVEPWRSSTSPSSEVKP